ncbi:hypothetical protein D3C73_1449940 [compost metagenome]
MEAAETAALMAAIRDCDGTLTAVEFTYLAPNGSAATGLSTPRKTVGQVPPVRWCALCRRLPGCC